MKDQPRESGAFSRTIIGDFVPKPDIGSITEIHREREFYIRTAFQGYCWPSAGELCFQSQGCQTVLKAQELSVTQQGSRVEGAGPWPTPSQTMLKAAPCPRQPHSGPDLRVWAPHSAFQLPAGLGEHLVLKLGVPLATHSDTSTEGCPHLQACPCSVTQTLSSWAHCLGSQAQPGAHGPHSLPA